MRNNDLKSRTKIFALKIINLVKAFPRNSIAYVISKQILRSGTSVGANYRAACRARSRAEFLSKMGIVEEEADETLFWLELILETKLIDQSQVQPLMREANEITAMVVSSIKTARKNSAECGIRNAE